MMYAFDAHVYRVLEDGGGGGAGGFRRIQVLRLVDDIAR